MSNELHEREVKLSVFQDHLDEMNSIDGWLPKMWEAVGYLSWWGLQNWDTVNICSRGKGELTAVYTHRNVVDRTFVMGAIWRPEEEMYTFHS